MKLRALSFVVLGAAIGAGCGESHTGDEDAAIVFDASFPDTGVDAGPPPSNVGSTCLDDMDCEAPASACLTDISGYPLPEGYCSAFCTPGADECPESSTCVEFRRGAGGVCLLDCDLTLEDACPSGQGCTDVMGLEPVCLPGCDVDADCSEGLTCNPRGAYLGEGSCYDADGTLDAGCTSDADCPAGAGCLNDDPNFPGGVCLIYGCDPVANTHCPDDAQCLDLGFSGDYCFDGCATDDDCRDAYQCDDVDGRLTCQPRFVDANLGQPCNTATEGCPGGVCITEGGSGFPGNYCAAVGCDPAAADSGCPGDGVCIEASDGSGICLDGCATSDDCRDAYACRPSDADDPASPRACLPGCTSNAECSYEPPRWRPGPAYVCNAGTGYCTTPFEGANLGEPCVDFEECPGGSCLSEAEDGWPAGTCTYPGCRLSGTGPEAPCPSGSVCTDDGDGDPEIGVCVDACTVEVSPSECRPGYACVALTVDGTEGACRPACGDGDCAGGRSCQPSGLCE